MELCQSKDSVIDAACDKEVYSYVVPRLSQLKLEHRDGDGDGSKTGVDTLDTAVSQQQYDVKRPKLRGKQKKQKEIPKLRGKKKPTVAAAATAHTANQLCDVERPKLTAKQKNQSKRPPKLRRATTESDCSEDDDYDFTLAPKAVDKKTGDRSELRWLTDVERAEYERQVKESGGFDVDCFPACYDADLIQPVFLFSGSEGQEWEHKGYKPLANLAIQNYNYAHQDSKIELSRVVKANFKHDYPGLFYITFEARNAAAAADNDDGAQIGNIFQALVSSKYGADETVVFCRPKPTPPQSSSSSSSSS